jgi:mono/diheme cytochrome c family protein
MRRLAPLFLGLAALAEAQSVPVWHFDGSALPEFTAVGGVTFKQAGPRRPDYPRFEQKNEAATFDGKGARLEIKDTGANSLFDFKNGDALTVEAWVKPDGLRKGENATIIGKGRTDPKAANPSNQNWAMRLRVLYDSACLNFLFASPSDKGVKWHRWTTPTGFPNDRRWHHVAIRYEFGKPESIRGWIDGKEIKGSWDMDGATTEAPVVDDAPVWIGSSQGGLPNSSFRGAIDDLRLHRTLVPSPEIAGRFATTLPPVAKAEIAQVGPSPNAGNDSASGTKADKAPEVVRKAPKVDWTTVTNGQVRVELCEDWKPTTNVWPAQAPAVSDSYVAPAFGFARVPEKYVDTGVRAERGHPYLLRALGTIKLPAGKHRLLLRGRGASALFIDGKLQAQTPFPPAGTDNKPVKDQDKYLDLGGDFRFAPPGNRDAWVEFETKGGEHRVILESIVGYVINTKGSRRRPELGETIAAVSLAGRTDWQLLSPSAETPAYDDAGWAAYATQEETRLSKVDAAARAAARARQGEYWQKRRAAAQQWLASTPETAVPALAAGFPANNAIDHFIAEKIVAYQGQVKAVKTGGVEFYAKVFPILEGSCLECHQGGKAKGSLHLDSRAGALKGGKSDGPAIVPGDPAKSPLLTRIKSEDPDEAMPPVGHRLDAADIATIEQWIKEGAVWPEYRTLATTVNPLTADLAFLRRVTLDTVGVPPSPAEIAAFAADTSADKRAKAIDRLLHDPRAADHAMGYWQDVLAENPNILNPTLNNSGPFRWWIHESLLDHKPLDLMVTELLRLKGSSAAGGPAGFGIASQNDVPMAAKATIVTTAFLGMETKCARCHDAPAHTAKQEQVFALAALLETKPVKVPLTSSVSMAKLREGGRKPLIEVTLEPGASVEPHWPFPELSQESVADELALDPKDPRDRLATLVTAPQNERFAQVMANRLWARVMGRGLVEQPWDWERSKNSHPELLRWLGRELVRSGYDADHVLRLILNSHAYQRATDPTLRQTSPLFASPAPRRLSAEQVVDSMFAATGKPFRTEEASLDIDSIREQANSVTLGQPRRAWMLTSTSNERDRPALALPRIQAVCDVMAAFGWRASRPDPVTDRESSANSLQPAILGNGTMGTWVTRLSDDHGVTAMALEAKSADALTEALFLRLLSRRPTAAEQTKYAAHLGEGFANRVVTPAAKPVNHPRKPPYYVSWSNHLNDLATTVRMQEEAAARQGDPATERLTTEWRRRAEDVVWALVNSPEFLYN